MVDREYVTGYLKNFSVMLVGFVLAIGWILLVVSLPLSHDVAEVLASLCVIPLFGGILVSNVRIHRAARQRPSAIAYRQLPLWLRLVPLLLLVAGVAVAKAMKASAAPAADVHVVAWTGLIAAVVLMLLLQRKAKTLKQRSSWDGPDQPRPASPLRGR